MGSPSFSLTERVASPHGREQLWVSAGENLCTRTFSEPRCIPKHWRTHLSVSTSATGPKTIAKSVIVLLAATTALSGCAAGEADLTVQTVRSALYSSHMTVLGGLE